MVRVLSYVMVYRMCLIGANNQGEVVSFCPVCPSSTFETFISMIFFEYSASNSSSSTLIGTQFCALETLTRGPLVNSFHNQTVSPVRSFGLSSIKGDLETCSYRRSGHIIMVEVKFALFLFLGKWYTSFLRYISHMFVK